jgi:hypothetical protein
MPPEAFKKIFLKSLSQVKFPLEALRFEIIFDSLVLRFRDQRLKPFSYLAK